MILTIGKNLVLQMLMLTIKGKGQDYEWKSN